VPTVLAYTATIIVAVDVNAETFGIDVCVILTLVCVSVTLARCKHKSIYISYNTKGGGDVFHLQHNTGTWVRHRSQKGAGRRTDRGNW